MSHQSVRRRSVRPLIALSLTGLVLYAGATTLAQAGRPTPPRPVATPGQPVAVPEDAMRMAPGEATPMGQARFQPRADGVQPETSIDVDFPGGTVSEYVAAVKRACPTPVNVALSPEVASMELGPISLTKASASVCMTAMEWSLKERGRYQIATRSIDRGWTGSLTFAVEGGGPGALYPGIAPQYSDPSVQPELRTFAIGSLLRPGADELAPPPKLEELTQAIEAVLKLGKSKIPPKVLVHRETNILVIQGTAEHVALTQQVLRQIERNRGMGEGATPSEALVKEVAKLRQEVETLRALVDRNRKSSDKAE